MIVYFLYGKHIPTSREQEILVPLSIIGVMKNIVDECASNVTPFVQAFSLELAGEHRFATLAALAIVTQKSFSHMKLLSINEIFNTLPWK